ncbi:unnamed protein product [Penicillium olsonii]|uniref:Tyrosyl-DNA phosphodiesterase n=1 Tax=Penicillium olsonii TaxID=99116 RepID=A0A9W4HPR0_PENOL|nr:unnamed protein product [Penicillium olsonii]CAG8080542.1 unnamed protein product [Penicillium olsonii]
MERPSKKVKLSSETDSAPVSLASLHREISPPVRSQPSPRPAQEDASGPKPPKHAKQTPRALRSPVQLTHIRDLPAANNVDTVRLSDILGDPMIRECWQFNYLFDVDFLLSNFDEDVRSLVQVKVVHGSWQKEAPNRVRVETEPPKRGSGARFKRDLLAYLKAYGPTKTGALTKQLKDYDFQAVRAALVASVPSRPHASDSNSDEGTLWGWLALKDLMNHIPTTDDDAQPNINVQISSVATLGQTNKWLKDVFFKALAPDSTPRKSPKYSIIFPTPDEIRRSLDGYGSGGSIHMKTQSAAQQKQVQYMRPHLCQWAGDSLTSGAHVDLSEESSTREAGRRRAAPHIKTYIRFSDKDMKTIEWAMVSSANLSTQAWGAATNGNGEVRICSWEIGVVVWPELFSDDAGVSEEPSDLVMVPSFKRDTPASEANHSVVGFRMPYDLPLTPYGASDEPWCATASYDIPDWRGQKWI